MVIEFMKEGSLRQYLKKNYQELSFFDKFNQLHDIAKGLRDIHKQELMHCDFHSGNILYPPCNIADLGLCQPVDEKKVGEKIFGVMPYVAPEVLQEKPYTQASDIYSFSMICYEIFSGLPPYHGSAHDLDLILLVCKGKRPKFQIKIPQLLEDLIKSCWDADPKERPSANELFKTIRGWQNEIKDKKDIKFVQQVKETEEFNKTLPDEIKFPDYKMHPGVFYHSKAINTKQISKLLYGTKDLDLNISDINLDELNIQEDPQEESSAQIQILPK